MLVADANGIPISCHIDSAQIHEVRLARKTLEKVSVKELW
jgi:hypothetical protein